MSGASSLSSVSLTCFKLIVALAFFLDIFIGYHPMTYDVLMSAFAYTFVCAGISYLSNLSLTILMDLGKRRWQYTDRQLKCGKKIFQALICIINISIILQYAIIYAVTKQK
jgi:uncharacterized membrane protein